LDDRNGGGGMIAIVLKWPSNKLSPNARVHWSKKYEATKAVRAAAGWATRAVVKPGAFDPATPIRVVTIIFPPARYRFDEDNLKARCKAIYDGIADAIGVDDRHFRHQPIVMAETVKGGCVRIELEAA
jgi:crossover junction endodeoxyribonuclease RusA